MSQEIYNEGRVVGLSAWELFMREALNNGVPPESIPDEHEWLTSMIGSGASMVLKIPASTVAGVHDFELPSGSNLTAAGVIVANPFMGDCTWDLSNWATKVTSYGGLIENNSTQSPTSNTVPYDSNYSEEDYSNLLSEFIKITDGIVYTKGATWVGTSENNTQVFAGDGTTTSFEFSGTALAIVSVTINNIEVPSTEYSLDTTTNEITFTTAPETGVNVTVVYKVASSSDPSKDINPNFNNSSTVVRLYISNTLQYDVKVLFTGFANKRILQGVSGYAIDGGGYNVGGSTDTANNNWPDGGMLGPEIIPWSSKIVFCVPSASYALLNSLTRTLPTNPAQINIDGNHYGFTFKDTDSATVKSNSFIDFNSINLHDYYQAHPEASGTTRTEQIMDVPLGNADVMNELVAWYPGMDRGRIAAATDNSMFFPPALYAAQINGAGYFELEPIDVAAPGTVKYFQNATQASNYKDLLNINASIYHDTTNNTFSFAIANESNPDNWPGLSQITYSTEPVASITAGTQSAKFIALNDSTGVDYTTTGTSGTVSVGPTDNLVWDDLFEALTDNKAVDVLGTKLHQAGQELTATNTLGVTNPITTVGADSIKLNPGGTDETSITSDTGSETNPVKYVKLDNGATVEVGTNFIKFGNGLKLYISNTEPTDDPADIPIGSIGIGW